MLPPQFTSSEAETDYIAVPLWGRHNSVKAWTLIDLSDATSVCAYRWYLREGYAARNVYQRVGEKQYRYSTIHLNRMLLGLPGKKQDSREGDHKNRNSLDNRRGNLRIVTHAQNGQNVSGQKGKSAGGLRGVTYSHGRWSARVIVQGKRVFLGSFDDKHEAARIASQARRTLLPFSVED